MSSPRDPALAPTTWLAHHGGLAALVAILALVALVRYRLADTPLGRDEGEYAYAGQLILQGIPPYQLAYNMKFPGTYYAYGAILALLGQTAWAIRVGLLMVNAATALMLFFLGRRLLGSLAAAVGAIAFAVLSLDRWINGVFAHATHFVLLPAVAGLFVLSRAGDSGRSREFLCAGALLGTALLMKQHAVVFLPLAVGLAAWNDLQRPTRRLSSIARHASLLVAGAAVPFVVVCAALAAQSALGRFWFWTFWYASEYVSSVPLSDAWSLFIQGGQRITTSTLPVWALAGLGVPALWIGRWTAEARIVVTWLTIASFLAVCPGFYFRSHYFIVMLPAAGLLAGIAVASIDARLRRIASPAIARTIAVATFAAAVAGYVVNDHRYLFSMSPRELSRAVYDINPFIEAVDIARYLREHTTPQDRIAVVGSEPEIYFYANRKSATGYIYTYPLMEPQRYAPRMQDEMIREIEGAQPKYLVLVGISTSWLVRPSSDRRILAWVSRYVEACYELSGLADIQSEHTTVIRWDGEAADYRPRSPNVVYTFRRKSDGPCAVPR